MGCSSSKLDALPDGVAIEVIRNHHARTLAHLKLVPGSIKDKVKGLSSGRKSATWVMAGSQKRYMIYSYLVDMSKTGYRRQYISSVDGATNYCYFERTFNPYLKSHCYRCVAYDGSRVLFQVHRNSNNDLVVEINNANDPMNTMCTSTGFDNRPTMLLLDYRAGMLRWTDPMSGRSFNCGRVSAGKIKVQIGVDQILVVALAAIVAEIKELNGLLRLATYASPATAKKGFAVAMRQANHFMQSEPTTNRPTFDKKQMAFYAADGFVSKVSRGQSFTDSAYASANNSIASFRDNSRARAQSRTRWGENSGRERSQSRHH